MIKQIESILQNSWLELASRWILGLTFIYASYNKILFPADFAKIIYGYNLFPATLINLIAIILPFLELVVALALIFGIYPRSAVLIVNALLVAFIILLSINLIRGHEFNCGCFALQNSENNVSSQTTIIRDFVYLALGLQVYFYNRYRRGCLRQKGIS
ncbi:MAG: DoxX family membrane protein [Deltaproteobacteria bacterium]|nr:DoxX family membrane protein [Deltaproteobacteria bacterium]